MKRIALTLAAFALTGALAFADDAAAPVAKISTEVNSGLVYTGTSGQGATKPYAIDYGPGSSNYGPVVGVAFDLVGKNFGYSIEPIVKGSTSASPTNLFTLDHAYAWVAPADGLNLYAAAAGNADPFADLDDNGANNYSTTSLGAFYSNSGFTVGAQVQPVQTQVNGNNNSYWAGVNYALAKVVTLNAYGSNDYTGTLDQVHVSFALSAVPALTLKGGYNAGTLSTSSATNSFIDVTVAYALTDAFTAGVTVYADDLNANNFLTSTSVGANQAYYSFKPYVNYTINSAFALYAYYDGETTPYSSNGNSITADNQILGQLQFTPVAGTTIKFSVWYDTNVVAAGTLSSTYTGVATSYAPTTSTIAGTSAAVDVKFAF